MTVLDASVNPVVSQNAELLYHVTRWCMDHGLNIDTVRRLEDTPLGTVRATYYVLDDDGHLQIDPAQNAHALTATQDIVPQYPLPDPEETR